jgi:APA family basic amino acid/polyamine antiporter
MEQPAQAGLVRAIRRWDLTALAVNSIVGAGIFGLPSEVFRRIGVYSLVAFVVCGLVVSLIILCFAEVSSRFSGTGGPYLYAREAFGPVVGFEVGWLLWIARMTAFAANCNLFVGYLGFLWPAAGLGLGRVAVIGSVVLALTAVNLTGVRNAALVSNVFTVAKLLPLILFISVGLFFLHPGSYALGPRPAFGDFSVSVLLLIYAFSGFEMAVIPGGEVRDPGRAMPRALLTAIAFVVVFYFLIQVVAIGTLPGLADSTRPLADAGRSFLGPMGGAIISAGALVSILGNLNVILLVGARLPFAMAERGELPRFLAATHPRFRTPHFSVLLAGAVVLVLTLSGTFVYAATISVIARLLSYGATCAALPVLRAKASAPAAAFKAPAGVAAAGAALLLAAWLLSHSTGKQARDATIAALVGLLIYFVSRVVKRASARH